MNKTLGKTDREEHEWPASPENNMLILIMGTFDPPTCAHIAMGTTLAERFPDADIMYVPSGDAYLKAWKGYADGEIPDIHERALLLEGAIAEAFGKDDLIGGRHIGVSEVEADPALTDGKTYNTAVYFKKTTGKSIYIAIGSDQLEKFIMWYKVKELVDEFHFIVFCRGMSEADCIKILKQRFENAAERFTFVPFSYQDVSSTKVREACERGELNSVRDMLPQYVYDSLMRRYGIA